MCSSQWVVIVCPVVTAADILTVACAEPYIGNADWSTAKVEASLSDEEGPWWWQIWYGFWKSYASCFEVHLPYFVLFKNEVFGGGVLWSRM